MSGRDKSAERRQEQLTKDQQAQFTQQLQRADSRFSRMDELSTPYVDFMSGMASGDPEKMIQTAAVPLTNITRSQKAAEENIYDSIPSGAARDFALSTVKRDAPAQRAGVLNQGFMSALEALAGFGKQQGDLGLQFLGAGSRFGEAASQGNSQMMQAAQQRKAATMGAIGQFAGMAGNIFTGGGMGFLNGLGKKGNG